MRYSICFKNKAVKRAKEIGVNSAASELCIPQSTLSSWMDGKYLIKYDNLPPRLTIDRLCLEGCINFLRRFLVDLATEYTNAFATYLRFPDDPDIRAHYHRLKSLFRSDYFTLLTNLDGEYITDRLERLYIHIGDNP